MERHAVNNHGSLVVYELLHFNLVFISVGFPSCRDCPPLFHSVYVKLRNYIPILLPLFIPPYFRFDLVVLLCVISLSAMDSSFHMSEEDLAAMDLEQFFQENPEWDDGWPSYQQEEEEEEEEGQAGGAQIDISDHVEVTSAGRCDTIYN